MSVGGRGASSLPTQRLRGGGLTRLLRTPWQLKPQTHGPSSESSSQMPPYCRHSSCSHSPSSPEPEPPEPHSAVGRGLVTRVVLVGAGAQADHSGCATPTLLTRPRPGLLDLSLLLAGGLAELTGTGVGDTVAAAHGAGRGALTPGAHTLPRHAHGTKGAHRVSTGLCRGQNPAGSADPAGRCGDTVPLHPHSRQGPSEATCRLIWRVQAWTCSSHSLAYVFPSEPHTGWARATHSEGHTQCPVSASHTAPKRHCPQRSREEAPSPR